MKIFAMDFLLFFVSTTAQLYLRNSPPPLSVYIFICQSQILKAIEFKGTGDDDIPSKVQHKFWVCVDNGTPSTEIFGKWLIFRHFSELDEVWFKIKNAVLTDTLGGCKSAKCSTLRYNPTAGPKPKTNGVICIYTEEWNMDEIGFKAVEIAQGDIRYKTNAATYRGEYSHQTNGRVTIKTIFWNNGKPSLIRHNESARNFKSSNRKEDIWDVNVVKGPEPVCSEIVFGSWIISLGPDKLTGCWHTLKELIESESENFGAIKMVFPPRCGKFHVYTSKEQKDSVGWKLINIVRSYIKYVYEVWPESCSSSTDALYWNNGNPGYYQT